jgi:hypothetical protein
MGSTLWSSRSPRTRTPAARSATLAAEFDAARARQWQRPMAGEHVQLAESDPLEVLQVPGRAQHREEHVAVPLDLGPLVRLVSVLLGQFVHAELLRRRCNRSTSRSSSPSSSR